MLEKVKKHFKNTLLYLPVFAYAMMSKVYADTYSEPEKIETDGIQNFVWNIVSALTNVATVVAIGFVAWNGYKIMSSSTNPSRRAEAMSGLLWAILGAIVAIGAKWFVGVALGFKPNA